MIVVNDIKEPLPSADALLNKNVEIIVTIRGILTGCFEKALVIDVENGPDNFLVMTKEPSFELSIVERRNNGSKTR